MTRDELVETMARAISGAPFPSRSSIRKASDALSAIEAAGFVVVPTTLTDRQLLAMETGSSMAAVYKLALAHSPFKGKK
ncbi:hypothetical protein [Sphingomonas daechungensis]|uniref:hypothetical protein n=1 Tax=Sphingomonas daechungensis TaxID=1176646 RepID=UPI00378416F2